MISTLKRAQAAAERLNVRSALNPFLWLCAIFVPCLLGAVVVFDRSASLQPYCPLLIYTVVGLLVVTAVVGVGFAIFRPEKLQSEQYQLRQQALLVLQQRGETPQVVDPGNIVAIANPAVEQLASPEASE